MCTEPEQIIAKKLVLVSGKLKPRSLRLQLPLSSVRVDVLDLKGSGLASHYR
jgi:hypothetical protein